MQIFFGDKIISGCRVQPDPIRIPKYYPDPNSGFKNNSFNRRIRFPDIQAKSGNEPQYEQCFHKLILFITTYNH
jgi:hypothetical protein